MKALLTLVTLIAALAFAADGPPEWAYGIQTPAVKPPPDPNAHDATVHHLPGSAVGFTRAQANNLFGPGDWYPGDHPPMPPIVASGRQPVIWACSLCHFPNGKGKPENASVAGYPLEYFIQQMHDFRSDKRQSAEPRKQNTKLMIAMAKAMTDAEIEAAAQYFSSMKWTPWIKVVETETVPKMYSSVGMFMPLPGGEKEPIGNRIIETPANPEATEELRDPRSGFIAYAPIGSIAKGEMLVVKESGKTTPCGVCHGADLKGMGPVPGIAGRSPSYLVRQLYDIQQGTRKGLWSELMKPVVSQLSQQDMLNIAAYTASREP